jgi:hypothetical protein
MEKANWHVGTLASVVTSIHLTPSLILMMSNRVLTTSCLIITNIDFLTDTYYCCGGKRNSSQ